MQKYNTAFELSERLFSLAKNGSLPHTLIIEGGETFVRSEIATELCMAFVCENKHAQFFPCKECRACKKARVWEHPDAISADEMAKNNKNSKGTVTVDDVRKIKTDAFVMPYEADSKIFVFANAHLLNSQSQNALLKLLEEPPMRVYFVFLCPSAKMLLQTVRSRATIFSAGKLSFADAEKYIANILVGANDITVKKTARLYVACDGLEPEKLEVKWLENVFENAIEFFKNGVADMLCLNKKNASGEEYKLLFNVLAMGARDIMLCRQGSDAVESYDYVLLDKKYVKECPFTAKYAAELYNLFTSAAARLGENANIASVLAYIAAHL